MGDIRAWVVRIPADLVSDAERKGMVAIGWPQLGDLAALNTREALVAQYCRVYPDNSRARKAN